MPNFVFLSRYRFGEYRVLQRRHPLLCHDCQKEELAEERGHQTGESSTSAGCDAARPENILDLQLLQTCHRLSLSPQDYSDADELLASANVDHEALCLYAYDAAHFSTGGKLPDLQFVQNSAGKPDVAMFDFTCMHRAENASLVRERNGKKLLMGLVGDCLVEVRGEPPG